MSVSIESRMRGTVRFPSVSEDAYFDSVAASLQGVLSRGARTLLVTSSGPGEGKSTVTASLGCALARTGKMSVVLVDTDGYRPSLHRLLGLENRRGLGELVNDLYYLDIEHETPSQFGVGDWVEILQAQGRSGRLSVVDGDEQFELVFHKGRIVSIQMPHRETTLRLGDLLVQSGKITESQKAGALALQQASQRALGEILQRMGYVGSADLEEALASQFRESLRRLVTLRTPECTFTETADPYLPATSGRPSEPPLNGAAEEFGIGRLADYLKRPFLASQIPSYLMDTPFGNLKVLTSGASPFNLMDARYEYPFRQLVQRLRRAFDVVLMDSPPVALTSPAETIAGAVDGVILVVKADGFDIQIIQQAKAQLDRQGANILGVVLNQVDTRHTDPLFYYQGAYAS